MKASDDNTLPATARQIFYVARPLIEEQTGKPLDYAYFSQTLLPNYVNEHGADWDVVYDDRGHFMEPHAKRVIGLGTLNVRDYLSRVGPLEFDEAGFDPASVKTYGPNGAFGAVLYVEKEGFSRLWKRVKLAKRYDIAIMSSKGMSVTAARKLVDQLCSDRVPLLVLHDFDSAGIIIKDTLANDTRRYSYSGAPNVIDLGLQYGDIDGLPSEPASCNISAARLRQAGLDQDAIDFLQDTRVELNAMPSRQLVEFVEAKLKQHRIEKVIPDSAILTEAYQMFATSERLSDAFDELKQNLADGSAEPISVPSNLEAKVRAKMHKRPEMPWHEAVRLIVDPDWTPDDDDEDNEGDDEGDD